MMYSLDLCSFSIVPMPLLFFLCLPVALLIVREGKGAFFSLYRKGRLCCVEWDLYCCLRTSTCVLIYWGRNEMELLCLPHFSKRQLCLVAGPFWRTNDAICYFSAGVISCCLATCGNLDSRSEPPRDMPVKPWTIKWLVNHSDSLEIQKSPSGFC